MAPAWWFLVFFGVWWLPLMLVAAEEQQREGCSSSAKTCGNLNISDPFWLANMETGRSCGSSDFEVTCSSNTPVLWSSTPMDLGFEIIDIFYKERSLRVADGGKLNFLHASSTCQLVMWNTSVKVGMSFMIDPSNQNLILYNCKEEAVAAAAERRDRELVQTRMKCRNESKVLVRTGVCYDETSNYGGYAIQSCNATVIPVLGTSSGEANASDFEQLINDGFLLTWGGTPHPAPARKFTRQIIF